MRRRLLTELGLAAACGLWAPSAKARDLSVIRVVVFPGGFNWPIWVAQERGFFVAEGLDVQVTPTPNSVFQLSGLIEGTFDLAHTAFDNIVAYDEGQGEAQVTGSPDLVAVMGGDNGFLRLVTIPEIASYADLKDRELSVDALTTGYAFVLRYLLERGGLGIGDYKLVRAGGALQRFESLMEKKQAGTLLLSPFEVIAEDKGFHLLNNAIDVLENYQGVVGAARRSWARSHAEEVQGYIKAYVAALDWLYAPENKTEAIAIFRRNLPNMAAGLVARSYDILLDRSRGFAPKAKIGQAGVETVLSLRTRFGEPHRTLDDPASYLDESFYNNVFGR